MLNISFTGDRVLLPAHEGTSFTESRFLLFPPYFTSINAFPEPILSDVILAIPFWLVRYGGHFYLGQMNQRLEKIA
jgi:hypothetical protein